MVLDALGLAKYLGHLRFVFLAPGELVGMETRPEGFQQLLATGTGADYCLVKEGVALVAPFGLFGRRTLFQIAPRRQNRLDPLLPRHRTPR